MRRFASRSRCCPGRRWMLRGVTDPTLRTITLALFPVAGGVDALAIAVDERSRSHQGGRSRLWCSHPQRPRDERAALRSQHRSRCRLFIII